MTPEETARFEEIERRLAMLEAKIGASEAGLRPVHSLPVTPPVPPPRPPSPIASTTPPLPPVAARELPRHNIETAFGLTWLSRIAVLTIVLALAFFFKYAFENHWISEWGRILLGAGAGAAALAFGERFWRGEQRAYGQALTAAGICFFYLSCWAAFGLYHLLPQPAIFGVMIVITVGAGILALRYDSAAVAMLGLAGGFATPLLLGSEQDIWFVFGYALALDAGASFAARLRHWRWLEMLALAGTIVLYLDQVSGPAQSRAVFTLFVVAWYLLFAASKFLPVFLPAQLLTGVALVQIWKPDAEVLPALLIVAAAGLAVADWRGWSTAVTISFAGFWLAYASWRAQAGTPSTLPVLALLTASYLLFLAWPAWRARVRGHALRFQDLMLIATNAVVYFGAGYGLLWSGYAAWQGLFAVAVAVVQMAAARWLWGHDARGSLLSAGTAWVLLVLAAPIQFAGYRITVAWAVEGSALTWIGVRLRNNRVVAASLLVFLLVCGRLAALDSQMYADPSDYSLLVNARFVTFAMAAASLWAAAWWIRQGTQALVTYLTGHFVMLWGLCQEAAGWAQRTGEGDVRSVISMSISVLVAAYAVMLVAGGVARRSAITRVAGIVLIGLVVLKLYLYDVWLLGQFYRMAAFAILGVLLLAMSYLYSRYRASIDTWWRP
ncbi:MAG TPA: DUF2339 domain-containing protein [Bryobacteraceae bacterium]